MLTAAEAHAFAEHWIAAWNAHDLERILTHYSEDVELTSPVVVQLLGVADGTVRGKGALRAYFARGLAAFPQLRFTLERVAWGVQSVVLVYANQRGTRTAEFMELAPDGKVLRVVANYDG
jgi:predicted ester cyclase